MPLECVLTAGYLTLLCLLTMITTEILFSFSYSPGLVLSGGPSRLLPLSRTLSVCQSLLSVSLSASSDADFSSSFFLSLPTLSSSLFSYPFHHFLRLSYSLPSSLFYFPFIFSLSSTSFPSSPPSSLLLVGPGRFPRSFLLPFSHSLPSSFFSLPLFSLPSFVCSF